MKTGLFTSKNSELHDTGEGHPENKYRVLSILKNLEKKKFSNLIFKKPKDFNKEYLKITHDLDYLNTIENSFPSKGIKFLDGDTILSPGSANACNDAVGSVISAIESVKIGKIKNAFCVVRPPGHHAEYNKAMGFCVYNNVAVGANYLLQKYKLKKIAIIDFDVHHGNGTQNIFYNNQNVLYCSTHQYPLFPGTGKEYEKGKYGNIVNIPLPAGTNSENYLNAYEHILKKIKSFRPEFVLFSAGFDAHKDDPLSNFGLKSVDFYEITRRTLNVSKKFCKGNVVSILEGGYNLEALSESCEEHIKSLMES